jgi:hypothetical protein
MENIPYSKVLKGGERGAVTRPGRRRREEEEEERV